MTLVSVVMPNFNGGRFLEQAMRSVLGQLYDELELIVVDDASTDHSRDIIAGISDLRLRVIRHPECRGAAAARNSGIAAARGRYIAFLDADDLWELAKLSRQVALHELSGCILSYTSYRKIDESGTRLGLPLPVPESVTYRDLLGGCPIGCSTAMYDTAQVGKVYMPEIRRRQDYALWLKLLRPGGAATGLQECLTRYRVCPNSLSANKMVAALYQWRVLREIEQLPLGHAALYFSRYAVQGTARFMY